MSRARAAAVSFVAAFVAVLGTVTGLVAPTAAHASGTPTSTIVSSAPAPNGAAGTTYVLSITYDGIDRDYRVFVPSKVPAGPRPLVVALHGFNGDATYYESVSNLDSTAGKNGIFVIYPDGLNESWNAGTCCGQSVVDNVDDVGFIAAVIKDFAAWRSIDRNRIAIDGVSNGGMMAYRFACERSDLVDVIDVMVGTDVAPTCSFSRPVSLLHVHGLADQLVPFNGGSSSVDPSGFPSVKGGLAGYAAYDGCSGWSTSLYNGRSDDTEYDAQNCPAGTHVELVTSQTMGHVYSTGSTSVAKYGVDMTGMAWGFTGAAWASRPAPAAL
jgi:polyhydroxybutyrate depolymerase